MFTHAANTPNENVHKHTGFKGFSARLNNIDVYVVMHLDSNPNGHTSRFHSYQMWTRDAEGGEPLARLAGLWPGRQHRPRSAADPATTPASARSWR